MWTVQIDCRNAYIGFFYFNVFFKINICVKAIQSIIVKIKCKILKSEKKLNSVFKVKSKTSPE